LVLLRFAVHFDHRPRRLAVHAMPDTTRALLAALAVFAVAGFGLVRLLLPERLRGYELLWVAPTGACALGVAMTLLGFAGVPYTVSLSGCLVAFAALGVHSVRRRGWPAVPAARLGWPLLLAFVVFSVALVPMVFEQHYIAVTGTGSDAHVAAGTANFLKHSYPLGLAIGQPIDRMPPLWGSKFPIYYALAAVSSVSGLDTWQVLPVLAGLLLAMAAVGMFLIARELFGARPAIAVVAMALAGLNRMALHTGLNPYFNQTWGYFAMPFTFVLGWWVVQPDLGGRPHARRGMLLLLALFAVVLVFAYPLAAPIPAVPIAVFLWSERRRRLRAGERVLRVRDLYRGRRSLVWMIPVCVLLLFPFGAVLGKAAGAAAVLAPGRSLAAWGGDLRAFIPFNFFLSLPDSNLGNLLVLVLLYLAIRGLRGQPRSLAWGLGGLLAIGLVVAVYLRHRAYGYYFHFKLLAFCGPLLVAIAAVGADRLKRLGPVWLAVFALATGVSAYDEVGATGFQLSTAEIELRDWATSLPAHASIRLDMQPATQLWSAYMLAARPLCSQKPLTSTDYPHVPRSRKADYIVAALDQPIPRDAAGPPLRANQQFALYRENPAVPGVDHCSQRRQSRIFEGRDRVD
jgi:hypothetical protein